MIVAELTERQLDVRLRGEGLALRTGVFVTRIHSTAPSMAPSILRLYANHQVVANEAFCDFDVAVRHPAGPRRYLRKQVEFELNGHKPYLPLPEGHAFPMLEWGLNWCISAFDHAHMVIHAAAIERNGRVAIMPAPPGSGKSTLCAGLVLAGWRLLSDELALIDPGTGAVAPLTRPISLKNESINVIASRPGGPVLGETVHGTSKGSVAHLRPPSESLRGDGPPALPAWVIVPSYDRAASTGLQTLGKASAFMQLVDAAFNYHVLGRRAFDVLARLVDACDCYTFDYSNLDDAVAAFDRLDIARR